MSCSTCGSNVPCGCIQTGVGRTCVDPCGVPAGCSPSSCQPCLPASPVPFYACAPACPESHTQTLVQQQFYFDISAQNSWNIPACGLTAVLAVPGLKSINVGSYIWKLEFGYFEVTAFDVTTGQVTILNHCNDGNAAVGTNVPACTTFTLGFPPCDCGTDSDVCVAIDFTAPDVSDCIDITLTSTTGLAASDVIQIGTGFYTIEEIKPNNIVTICNTGDGITPGTPVIALDANGNYQYCIGIISSNPCERTLIDSGTVLVCDGDGTTAPLTGIFNGVLTLTNETTGVAAYSTAIPDAIVALEADIDCIPQLDVVAVPATLYSFPVTLTGYTFELLVDSSVVSITLPNTCPGVFYTVSAEVNIVGLANHTSGVIMHEMQLAWSAFEQGGRVCYTDFGSDGFDLGPGPYPATTQDAIWGILQSDFAAWPMMYNGSTVVNRITLVAGTTVDLVLRYKTTIGDNNEPPNIDAFVIYLVGSVSIARVP